MSAAFWLANILSFSLAAYAQPLQPNVVLLFPGSPEIPYGNFVQGSDGSLYGATSGGGTGFDGMVFQVTTNGAVNTLVSFAYTNGESPQGLTLGLDGNFYGTTRQGGSGGVGTVFQVTTNGALTTLASFAGTNGANPQAPLTLGNDGNFYGTTSSGGDDNDGTVFQVTTNGVLTSLASFASTNGADPVALTLGKDGNFYGMTYSGGNRGLGTVFQVTTNGALTTLLSFGGANGENPEAGLTLGRDGSFYGTTYGGGSHLLGTIFRVTTNGVLTTLGSCNNTNGANPTCALMLGNDGNFYGTTYQGGNLSVGQDGAGTVFQVTTNGVLTTLASFNGVTGALPRDGLALGGDGNLYGMTTYGGKGGGSIYYLRHGAYIQSYAMTSQGFELNVLNVGGSGTVVLESSSDLAVWRTILTNGPVTTAQFLDTSIQGRSEQFYRVLQQ